MAQWETVRRQAAVAGRVVNGQTGGPLAGAIVQIAAGPAAFTTWLHRKALAFGASWKDLPERPDLTRTKPDGHFHFMDLPDGSYTLAASLPGTGTRYGAAQAAATVTRDGQGRVQLALVKIALPPTTVKGHISRNGSPVVMAEVRVKGSGESTYSDAAGDYVLAGVEAGNRVLLVSAQGCLPASQPAGLPGAGAVQTADFMLVAL